MESGEERPCGMRDRWVRRSEGSRGYLQLRVPHHRETHLPIQAPTPRRRRQPCSNLPEPREDSDSWSLQALARFRHHLITGNRFYFAAEILSVATLSLLEPKFLDVRIFSWVKVVDEHANEFHPFPRGEGTNAFGQLVELTTHDS